MADSQGALKRTKRPIGDEHAVDWLARMLALNGLGTTSGADRWDPPAEGGWEQGEWERRILGCVPGRVETHCRELAEELHARLTRQGP